PSTYDPNRTRRLSAACLADILSRAGQLLPAEGPVDLSTRNSAGEPDERPMLGDFLGGLQETGPGRAGQRAPDADPTDASLSQLGHGGKVAADEHVDRFGRDR